MMRLVYDDVVKVANGVEPGRRSQGISASNDDTSIDFVLVQARSQNA